MKLRRASRKRASRRSTRRRAQRGGGGIGRVYLMRDATGIKNVTLKDALAGSAVTFTVEGSNKITLSNIPASMGKLSNVKFSTWNNNAWTQQSTQQNASRVNLPMSGQGGTIALESAGKIVRRPGARGIMPAHTRLPAVLPTLTIRNIDTQNFGVLSTTGDPANGNTNICIHLFFD